MQLCQVGQLCCIRALLMGYIWRLCVLCPQAKYN
jgi:hypothetical protein